MTSTTTLYDIIDRADIHVEHFPLTTTVSMCIDNGGDYYIALDPNAPLTDAQQRVVLAHETGHCLTGSFYNRYSNLNCITKQERTANRWAVYTLVPWRELSHHLQDEEITVWQLAELFGVTGDFVQLALQIYQEDGVYHPPISTL